VYRITYITHYV